jgi:hypothetical protein
LQPQATNKGFTLEGIPKYVYHQKYKLMRWFEDNSMCPLDTTKGFPAWVGWKATMAAGGAITTPKQGMAGYRTLNVQGFCPFGGIPSSKFACVTDGSEIKARAFGDAGIDIRIDDFFCKLQDISLYKLTDGFTGIRLDFSSCSGQINLGFNNKHVPKTAAVNMQLTEEVPDLTGKTPSPQFTDFFKAVCGGGSPANFRTTLIPNFAAKLVPRKPGLEARQMPVCFAHSANTAHVIGKSCYDDFVFFDLHGPMGKMAKIPATDLDSLRAMIPQAQPQLHPVLAPMVGSSIAPMGGRRLEEESKVEAPKEEPRELGADPCGTSPQNPCGTVAPQPAASPCGTVPPHGTAPPSPCGTVAPIPPPKPTCGCTTGDATCSPYTCPKGYHLHELAGLIPCHGDHHDKHGNAIGNAACTKADLHNCCTSVVTTTTTTNIPEVPGVVIADRICISFWGCACNNDCECISRTPVTILVPPLTTPPPTVKYCYDYWLESLMIGLLSFYPCLWVATKILQACILHKDSVVVSSTTERIQAGSTLHNSLRSVNAQDGFIGSIAPASPIYGSAAGRDVGVVKHDFLQDSFGAWVAGILDAIAVCLVCSSIVHLVWFLWNLIMTNLKWNYVLGVSWNGMLLWTDECPFSLTSIWCALAFIIWWAHMWLFVLRTTRHEKTQAGFVQSMVYAGTEYGQQGAQGQVPDGWGRPWRWFWQPQ